jgi:peptidoglycan/LPS O-acetylase OafA/YrhL
MTDHHAAPTTRVEGIDVLRGVAVLLVVLHHIHLRFVIQRFDVATQLPKFWTNALFWSGYYAVIAFFVISGFLITSLSLRRWGSLDRVPVATFYRLRAARILPLLLLLLAVLSVLHLAQVPGFVIPPERASLTRALIAGLGFHVNWLEGHHGYLPGNWDVLWSLSIEETFYVLFPLACLALQRERLMLWPLVALIVVGPFNRVVLGDQEPWATYHWLSGMDGIAFGCLAAWISVRRQPGVRVLRAMALLGAALVLFILGLRPILFALGIAQLGLNPTLLELGTALLLIGIAGGVGARLMTKGTGLIRLAGRCSYEIYLTHMFVVLPVVMAFRRVFPEAPPSRAMFPLTYAVMLAMSVALGWLVAHYFSGPANHWLRERSAAVNSNAAVSA